MKIGKKILLMLSALFVLTIGAGVLYAQTLFSYSNGELSKTYVPLTNDSEEDAIIEATEPLTILLMGVDTGSASRTETWAGNSDTMILMTLNPDTQKTTMLSLERDIMVELYDAQGNATGETAKLNAAYAYYGYEGAIHTIEAAMNTTIDHYALINMQGLQDLVNAVGGITVNNTLGFTISISAQEPEFTATIDPGEQTINGEQAVVYARMRYDDPEGDYGRQKRQREVIQLLIEKLISMDSVTKYQSILSAISSNMQTNVELSSSSIPKLMGYADTLGTIESLQLEGQDAYVDGVSYQMVTAAHLLEMQNAIQTSLGKEVYTELTTNIVTYESYYGYSTETYYSDTGTEQTYSDPATTYYEETPAPQ